MVDKYGNSIADLRLELKILELYIRFGLYIHAITFPVKSKSELSGLLLFMRNVLCKLGIWLFYCMHSKLMAFGTERIAYAFSRK